MKINERGSMTLLGLLFLMAICGVISYQLSIYHSKLAVRRSLIHEYRVESHHQSRK